MIDANKDKQHESEHKIVERLKKLLGTLQRTREKYPEKIADQFLGEVIYQLQKILDGKE